MENLRIDIKKLLNFGNFSLTIFSLTFLAISPAAAASFHCSFILYTSLHFSLHKITAKKKYKIIEISIKANCASLTRSHPH